MHRGGLFIYEVFKIVQGSDLNAGIQSDIADQYGVLTGTFYNQAGRWRMAFGGSGGGGGCGAGAFNGFWGCSSKRNDMFYTPLVRKDNNRQREDILLLKGSLGNCCTGHPCPPDLLGNSLWFYGESFRVPLDFHGSWKRFILIDKQWEDSEVSGDFFLLYW